MLLLARDVAAFGVLALFAASLTVWVDVLARIG